MEESIWPIVLGSSLLAAALTQGVAWAREWLTLRRRREKSALRVVLALEAFARDCLALDRNIDLAFETNGESGEFRDTLPPVPDIDEATFDPLTLDHISNIHSNWVEVSRRNAVVSNIHSNEGAEEAFRLCQRYAVVMAFKSFFLAKILRSAIKIPAPHGLGLDNLLDQIMERVSSVKGVRNDIAETITEMTRKDSGFAQKLALRQNATPLSTE